MSAAAAKPKPAEQEQAKAPRKRGGKLATAWKPGQSGNPAGRKPGSTLEWAVRRALSMPFSKADPRPKLEVLAELIARECLKLNMDILPLVLDRCWPKKTLIGDADGGPLMTPIIAINVTSDSADAWEKEARKALGQGEVVDAEVVPAAPQS